MGMVGIIRGHSIHTDAPCRSLLALSCVLGVDGFVLGRRVQSIAFEDVGFIRCRWVHSRTPWGSLGSCGVVEFFRTCPGGCSVHSGSLGSFARHGGHWVNPGSLGALARALRVVGFIRRRWVQSRVPWVSMGSAPVPRARMVPTTCVPSWLLACL